MNGARLCALAAAVTAALACGFGPSAMAAPPLAGLIHFERIDADPNKAYTLTDKNGPWLIMATTFRGRQAADDAQKLVYEFRKQYKLPAYTHRMSFDYSAKQPGRGLSPRGGPQRMQFNQRGVVQEVAVLVGDYDAVDDPRAQKVLERIKFLRPEALGGEKHGDAFQTAKEGLRGLQQRLFPAGDKKKQGPMRLAFITTNPLLPETYFQPKGVDHLVVEMNSGVEHSLLSCPGNYTVKVATFSGNVVVEPKRLKQIEKEGAEMTSRLAAAAERAHNVAVFLRAKGFEAYEYHDRHSSIVTVGSFAALGVPQINGSVRYSPEVQAEIERFRAKPGRLPDGTMGGPITPEYIKTLKTYLDPQPMPIEVPRRSFGSDYVRQTLIVQ